MMEDDSYAMTSLMHLQAGPKLPRKQAMINDQDLVNGAKVVHIGEQFTV